MKSISCLRGDGVTVYPLSYAEVKGECVFLETQDGFMPVLIPAEFQCVKTNCPEGVLNHIWCAVDSGNHPFCLFRFDDFSQAKRDVLLHIFPLEQVHGGQSFATALRLVRFNAMSLREVTYVKTETEDVSMVSVLQSCGFELMRVDGARYHLEFRRHYSGRFPLYFCLSLLLAFVLYFFFENAVTAIAVALSIGLGGGLIYDSISQQRFQAKRARMIYPEMETVGEK